jgi:hypothetical protein
MILPKEENAPGMRGTVFFSAGRVVKISRPGVTDDVNEWSDDLVALARAISRELATEAGDAEKPAFVSVQHERMGNAEEDVVSIRFADGSGIELTVGTTDKPNAFNGKRDFANLEETLEPAR